jgi:hypothetical protein
MKVLESKRSFRFQISSLTKKLMIFRGFYCTFFNRHRFLSFCIVFNRRFSLLIFVIGFRSIFKFRERFRESEISILS